MAKKIIITNIIWEGIPIEIKYTPEWSPRFEQEKLVSHIEVQANQPLPITNTGYRSIFFFQLASEMIISADDLVIEKLNTEAVSAEWQTYQKDKQQLKLF